MPSRKGSPNRNSIAKSLAVSVRLTNENADPIGHLISVMNDPSADPVRRDKAAIELASYGYAKVKACS